MYGYNGEVTPYLSKHGVVKQYRVADVIAPHITNLSTRWRGVISLTPCPLYRWVTLVRLDVSQTCCGHFQSVKNIVSLLGIEPLFIDLQLCSRDTDCAIQDPISIIIIIIIVIIYICTLVALSTILCPYLKVDVGFNVRLT